MQAALEGNEHMSHGHTMAWEAPYKPDISKDINDGGGDDDDDGFEYAEVEVDSIADGEEGEEELEDTLSRLAVDPKRLSTVAGDENTHSPALSRTQEANNPPEVVEDFIRNYLVRMGFSKAFEAFETEWYDRSGPGALNEHSATKRQSEHQVPDAYAQNQQLAERVVELENEIMGLKDSATKTADVWQKYRRERDFHRMHHKRIGQEKARLINDLKKLKAHYSTYEPTIKDLKAKYESATKEKTLLRLERDRISARFQTLEREVAMLGRLPARTRKGGMDRNSLTTQKKKKAVDDMVTFIKEKMSESVYSRPLPLQILTMGQSLGTSGKLKGSVLDREPGTMPAIQEMRVTKKFDGHSSAVTNLALHPIKDFVATTSDDCTWKLWSIPEGDLIMCGEGHRDWVSGISFHPSGAQLASSSGDSSIKLWDFHSRKCTATLMDHTHAVWAVEFHSAGHYMASASMDHCSKLWDVTAEKSIFSFRGHLDSVNSVCWHGSLIATASSDKTISVWDPRSGSCVQTFNSHTNSCNYVTASPKEAVLASVDANGIVRLWDMRTVSDRETIDFGPHPGNHLAFDATGSLLLVSCDDSRIKSYDLVENTKHVEMLGHTDAVHATAIAHSGKYILSASADSFFMLWE